MNGADQNDATRGVGWLYLAGVLLLFAGILNVIWGIAAIDGSTFFSDDGRYVLFDDLSTWGWFLLIAGILQIAAAFSVWNGNDFGRVMGIAFASLNALILLLTVNAFPFAAFMLFLVDLGIIYGLAVYGSQRPRA